MMKLALALTALAAFPLAAAADVTKEDIKKLVGAGISEEVILTYIRSNAPAVKLSADDVVELKQAGASERVLNAMMGSPAPAPESRVVERVVEKPVYVPQTTYVSTPTYSAGYGSGSWCSSHYSYDGCGYYSPSYYYSSYHYPRYYYPRYYYRPSYGFSYYGSRGRHCSSRVGWSVGFSW